MSAKLYVGNLTFDVQNADLEEIFSAHGSVKSAQVIMDRDTGRSKGFGFVEMSGESEASAAIAALNGREYKGRAMTVSEARPREDRNDSRNYSSGGGRSGSRRY